MDGPSPNKRTQLAHTKFSQHAMRVSSAKSMFCVTIEAKQQYRVVYCSISFVFEEKTEYIIILFCWVLILVCACA
jgi:hypothetical protein